MQINRFQRHDVQDTQLDIILGCLHCRTGEQYRIGMTNWNIFVGIPNNNDMACRSHVGLIRILALFHVYWWLSSPWQRDAMLTTFQRLLLECCCLLFLYLNTLYCSPAGLQPIQSHSLYTTQILGYHACRVTLFLSLYHSWLPPCRYRLHACPVLINKDQLASTLFVVLLLVDSTSNC